MQSGLEIANCATILSVGTELTTGQMLDTNASWLAGRLTELGAVVTRCITVGDALAELRATMGQAIACGGVVIATGGLGPTPDDLTRQALAEALAQPLEEDPQALEAIRAFFVRRERSMPDSNRLQALRPRGCTTLPNRLGTAAGICLERPDLYLAVFPGVPAEMKAMFEETVGPAIRMRIGARPGGTQIAVLRSFGLSEANIGETLADLMRRGRNPSVGTTASRMIIAVRVVARALDESTAKEMLAADVAEIKTRLGNAIFGGGDDTLQDAVGRLLLAKGLRVSTAESCTGGLLAKYLTDVPGSSAYFRQGYVTYADEAKAGLLGVPTSLITRKGAVSEIVARELAVRCREAAQVDFALSTTGIAGPSGGRPPEKPVGLVFVALAGREGVKAKRLLLGETLSREEIRDRACKAAMNLLRLHLLER